LRFLVGRSKFARVGDRTTFGYARPDDGAYIGYRVDGEGPIDIVYQPEWPGNIDMDWQGPVFGSWLRSFSSFARVITHDHRGVGLSSRDVQLPNLETRVFDLLAVLRATGTRRPVLLGGLSSGAVHVLLAAMRPRLPRAIIWLEPAARYSEAPDYPWGVTEEDRDLEADYLSLWGTEDYAKAFVEEQAAIGNELPPEVRSFHAVQTRNACTPDVALRLNEIWDQTDVRGVLEAVNVPTLLLVHEERKDSIEEAEYVASRMPAAELRRMPGSAWTLEEQPAWAEQIREFVGVAPSSPETDTVLSTVLFTDIVGSTERQASLGDRDWKNLVSKHHGIVRETLGRYKGTEIDTAGDGFYATFDGPARAVHCALEIGERVRVLGIEIRAGVHTGECEVIDGKVGGIAVSIGKRISDLAGPSDVLASQTVKDLVAGSGLSFEDAGEHELKGVPSSWHIFRVVSLP
jgi:class 3 adenylate cyclase/pimeloyl-ACP methyl ester carboxylesterase